LIHPDGQRRHDGGADLEIGREKPRLESSKIRRAASIFILGSVAIILITLFVTTDEETWTGMAAFGGWLFAAVFAGAAARMLLEALGLLVLVNGTQEKRIGVIESVELTLEAYFIGQLIPVSAAGVPYQAFLLARRGVRAGWATALVLVKGFVPSVFFFGVLLVSVGMALLGWRGSPATLTFLKIVGPISAVPLSILIALLVIMLRFPKVFDRIVDRGAGFLAHRLRGRPAEHIEEGRARLEEESRIFRDALRTLGRKKRWVLLWGSLLVVAAFLLEFYVGVIILWGFGYRGSVVVPVILQCLLKPVLYSSPTPGSLAVGEGGYLGFFAAHLPAGYIGVSLVLWRLAIYFVPMLVGGLLVARRVGGLGRTRASESP